jgi:3-oxoacyl-[acyl-carrier protein] reductase
VAERLARSGHQVAITGRRAAQLGDASARLLADTGVPVRGIVGDIADPASAELARDVDVLVLNAGGPAPGRITDIDDAQWQSAFELLVLGPIRFARLAAPEMAKRGFGRIVVVTSTAVRQPQPDLAASTVLRSSVTSAAKLLSLEFAADGVTVNCVAPGPTDTARRRQILAARAQAAGIAVEDADALDAADVPAGRAGQPAEIAAAVAFLASAEASYVNGTVLTVDGGRTETI